MWTNNQARNDRMIKKLNDEKIWQSTDRMIKGSDRLTVKGTNA